MPITGGDSRRSERQSRRVVDDHPKPATPARLLRPMMSSRMNFLAGPTGAKQIRDGSPQHRRAQRQHHSSRYGAQSFAEFERSTSSPPLGVCTARYAVSWRGRRHRRLTAADKPAAGFSR